MEMSLWKEFWESSEHLFPQGRNSGNKVLFLLILGPVAVLGDATGLLGQAFCFFCSGIALIPCAERLSWVTEQVAAHTNGTIGALLNATFGNAPELLICISALKAGYYRVVQLAMLGSMLTNMLLVFGVSCIIGGIHWHVQELRVTSGNSNVVMLLVATAGSLFPAALVLPGQLEYNNMNSDVPTAAKVAFCRFNAFVMLVLYLCFLLFQLASHKDEFDEELMVRNHKARRNMWCLAFLASPNTMFREEHLDRSGHNISHDDMVFDDDEQEGLMMGDSDDSDVESSLHPTRVASKRRRRRQLPLHAHETAGMDSDASERSDLGTSAHNGLAKKTESSLVRKSRISDDVSVNEPVISMKVGVVWLFIITLCISAMSDILVDSIEGFCEGVHISEVFTSMVIIPFFSNVAEQVSAFIFAYRNEMDLCVGVTVGSAIQIATFVLPGSVLIGKLLGRSMTLYFHAYETVCLLFSVIVTGAILQGGTTNWLTGTMLVGIYTMFAAGIWFHEFEDLTVDGETLISGNATALGAD